MQILSVSVLCGWGSLAFAQYDTDYSGDYSDYSYSDSTYSDTSSYDSGSGSFDSYGSFGSGGGDNGNYIVKPKVVVKRKERFIPPYDSTREMVSYTGIVEVKDNENFEVEVDTIYHRAKSWMLMEFGEKELKKMTTLDNMNNNASEMEYKIRLKGTFPCMIAYNEFRTEENGDVEFQMEIRIREGRYRYSVNSLVYVAEPIAGAKEGERTYFEYLMKAKDNYANNDNILLAADKQINSWIDNLRQQCQRNPIEEEDDW